MKEILCNIFISFLIATWFLIIATRMGEGKSHKYFVYALVTSTSISVLSALIVMFI